MLTFDAHFDTGCFSFLPAIVCFAGECDRGQTHHGYYLTLWGGFIGFVTSCD